jgi:hypothetical protein
MPRISKKAKMEEEIEQALIINHMLKDSDRSDSDVEDILIQTYVLMKIKGTYPEREKY